MSWFQYAARRFKGLDGSDYYRARKGYGVGKGDILFEIMEGRVMPRCVGKIERGPLNYQALWIVAQGLTTRAVKFGTITPEIIGLSVGNDHYHDHADLLCDLSATLPAPSLDRAYY